MAIAEHHPGELYGRNKGLLKMSHEQLHDFAVTKGLGKIKAPKAGTLARQKEGSRASKR